MGEVTFTVQDMEDRWRVERVEDGAVQERVHSSSKTRACKRIAYEISRLIKSGTAEIIVRS